MVGQNSFFGGRWGNFAGHQTRLPAGQPAGDGAVQRHLARQGRPTRLDWGVTCQRCAANGNGLGVNPVGARAASPRPAPLLAPARANPAGGAQGRPARWWPGAGCTASSRHATGAGPTWTRVSVAQLAHHGRSAESRRARRRNSVRRGGLAHSQHCRVIGPGHGFVSSADQRVAVGRRSASAAS